jgi:hypothetical protein
MRLMETALRWIWLNRRQYDRALGVLLLGSVAQSVVQSVDAVHTLTGLTSVAVVAFLLVKGQCALAVGLANPSRARDFCGWLVTYCPALAVGGMVLYLSSGPGQVSGNILSVGMLVTAAGARSPWLRLERNHPSISRPALAGAPQELR